MVFKYLMYFQAQREAAKAAKAESSNVTASEATPSSEPVAAVASEATVENSSTSENSQEAVAETTPAPSEEVAPAGQA